MTEIDDKIFIEDIREGQEVASVFLLNDLRLGKTKNGKPFVGLRLQDRTGHMAGRVWDGAEDFFRSFSSGDVAWVRGMADSFQNQVQLKVVQARPLAADQIDPAYFLPAAPVDPEIMFEELLALVASMADQHLRGLMEDILGDEDFASSFKRAPAAKQFHHAYLGGLLEHTLSVTRTASVIAPLYPFLNRDLLIAGAILHDLGKVREFDLGLSGDYTDEGRLLGHLIIGVEMLDRQLNARSDFPPELALLLKHLVVSHHGEYDMGSPKRPKILEALALHHLDDLDAKMNGIGGFITRHADDQTGWTDFNRLMSRFFYRHEVIAESESETAEPLESEAVATGTVEPAGEPDDELLPDVPEEKTDPDQLSFLKD